MEANDDQYWIVVNRNHAGPYTVGQLKSMGIAPDTYTWRRGLTQWVAASDIPELSAALWPAEPESSVAPVVEPVIFTPPAPPVRVVAQVAPVSPVTVPAGQTEADKANCPPSYLWWSIVVAVVFSLPLGVVAIVFAAQVGKQCPPFVGKGRLVLGYRLCPRPDGDAFSDIDNAAVVITIN